MGGSSGARGVVGRRRAALILLAAPVLGLRVLDVRGARAQAGGSGTAQGGSLAKSLEGLKAEDGSGETLPGRNPHIGPVTHLPLPRFVSLRASRANARRGPGLGNQIDWVFTRAGMPLKITAEYGHWRRVEDQDGLGGWVHYSLISGVRTVVVTMDMAKFLGAPHPGASVVYKAQRNVIGRLDAATKGWVKVTVEGDTGWAPKADVWGVFPSEIYH